MQHIAPILLLKTRFWWSMNSVYIVFAWKGQVFLFFCQNPYFRSQLVKFFIQSEPVSIFFYFRKGFKRIKNYGYCYKMIHDNV